ncbi:filamentous hemagglutinin N-terminal domain-containing protein [Candidatus Halobeggiatoa sp. HSG11]|nr:filamentous hemagglutinin N-terminal domain-containing protein [Candidatus Halobeggiatoa sp. HSG11]
MKYLLTILLLITTLSSNAEVITDSTLGQNINLPGPDFQIGADLGQQHGSNLLHSFQDFNLNSSESATFSGPNSVQNIISRVTGGNPSNIDGLIRSTIPNADMYFLNPYGIMFGPNAKLDVQGSFHASTADYLRLGENGRFDARYPGDSLLTVAPIEAFGFLTNNPASIELNDSKLSVSEGKTLSLIGGNLNGNGTHFSTGEKQGIEILEKMSVSLSAESGRINLASVASNGEVIPTTTGLDFSELFQGGQINLDHSLLDTSGNGKGQIFIKGGDIDMFTSWAFIHILGEHSNSFMQIQADNLRLEASGIISLSGGAGKSADIDIKISGIIEMLPDQNDIFSENSTIETDSYGISDFGNIKLEAKQLSLEGGSQIGLSLSENSTTSIKIVDTLRISGQHPDYNLPSGIFKTAQRLRTKSEKDSLLEIEANRIEILDGGQISVLTVASGNGGTVVVKAKELIVSGILKSYTGKNGNFIALPSAIGAQSLALPTSVKDNKAGDSGNIVIEAENIWLRNGGQITNTTRSDGKGGYIELITNELIAEGQQKTGNFTFNSGLASNSLSEEANAGNAGNIKLQANRIILKDNAEIATTTANATGGNIMITIPNLVYLQDGSITTSVQGGSGDGGNILIENPQLIVLNSKGQIKAQADAGHGGNINLKSDHLITSPNSQISASSRLGLDGNVKIESPDMDIEGALVTLKGEFKEASDQIKRPCSMRGSSFFVKKINGSPQTPYDYQPAQYLPEIDNKVKTVSKNSGEKLAFSTCKK